MQTSIATGPNILRGVTALPLATLHANHQSVFGLGSYKITLELSLRELKILMEMMKLM